MKNLSKKLVKVLGAVNSSVKKSGYNSHQGYNYVMEADLLEAVRGELIKNGILITTSVENVEYNNNLTTVRLKHTFIDSESGETMEVWSAGQGQDKGDKGIFKSLTGAYKYFLLKTFMLSGHDDPENDGVKEETTHTKTTSVAKTFTPNVPISEPKVTTTLTVPAPGNTPIDKTTVTAAKVEPKVFSNKANVVVSKTNFGSNKANVAAVAPVAKQEPEF